MFNCLPCCGPTRIYVDNASSAACHVIFHFWEHVLFGWSLVSECLTVPLGSPFLCGIRVATLTSHDNLTSKLCVYVCVSIGLTKLPPQDGLAKYGVLSCCGGTAKTCLQSIVLPVVSCMQVSHTTEFPLMIGGGGRGSLHVITNSNILNGTMFHSHFGSTWLKLQFSSCYSS